MPDGGARRCCQGAASAEQPSSARPALAACPAACCAPAGAVVRAMPPSALPERPAACAERLARRQHLRRSIVVPSACRHPTTRGSAGVVRALKLLPACGGKCTQGARQERPIGWLVRRQAESRRSHMPQVRLWTRMPPRAQHSHRCCAPPSRRRHATHHAFVHVVLRGKRHCPPSTPRLQRGQLAVPSSRAAGRRCRAQGPARWQRAQQCVRRVGQSLGRWANRTRAASSCRHGQLYRAAAQRHCGALAVQTSHPAPTCAVARASSSSCGTAAPPRTRSQALQARPQRVMLCGGVRQERAKQHGA